MISFEECVVSDPSLSANAFYRIKANVGVCSEVTALGRVVNAINRLYSAYMAKADEPSITIACAPGVKDSDIERLVGAFKNAVKTLLDDEDYLVAIYGVDGSTGLRYCNLRPSTELPEDTQDAVFAAIEGILT